MTRIPLLALLALAACTPAQYEPPVFTAFDPTQQCQAGYVGWDFSTGGAFGEDVSSTRISSELQVVEASFGANNECGLTNGNWTDVFAATCNGNLSCSRKVLETGDVNPKTGCLKSFSVKYRCGSEPAVYETNLPTAASTDGTTVSLSCNDKMTIKRVSYGNNCNPNLKNNFTTPIADACNGLRRCKMTKSTFQMYGSDPAVNCLKNTDVVFLCGDDTIERTATWNDTQIGDFTCPARQTVLGPDTQIRVVGATYGTNCGGATNNVKSWVEGKCANKPSCIGDLANFDPCPNVRKDWQAQYTCGNEGIVYTKSIPQQAQGYFTLSCADVIHIAEASYGKSCNAANANNLQTTVGAKCEGKRFCGPGTPRSLIADPAPGCLKTANFRWTCGDDPEIYSRDFAETELIQFECQVGRQQPGPSSGIRVEAATFGGNCDAGISNNAYIQATQACFGKNLCNFAATAAGVPDPQFGCQKELAVDYTCGEEPELLHAVVPKTQEGTPAVLTCGPSIRILNATWGLNVNGNFFGNATSDVQQQCDGRRGRCTYVVKDLVDPQFGQQKDFTITYACGPDPKPYTAYLAKPADNQSLTFDCATPTTPFVDKQCVPERCYDYERRSSRLGCVVDNSLVNLGVITSSTLTAKGAGNVMRAFAENQSYDLALRIERQNRSVVQNYVADAGTVVPVSPAAIWVSDQFTHIPGTPYAMGLETVPAFRCLIGTTALKLVDSTHYAGDITNAIISPNCFGSRISSWRDASKRVRWTETDFRKSYKLDETHSDVHVAFDPEGRAAVWRYNGGTGDQRLVPNPIGFFYDPTRLWADQYAYYSQTELNTTHPPVGGFGPLSYTFFTQHSIELIAQSTTLRETQVVIPLFDPDSDVSFDLDFVWSMQSDAPGRNPFSPTGTPVSPQVPTLAQRHFGATVELSLDPAPDSGVPASSFPWVSALETQVVNRSTTQPDVQLSEGLATGKSEHIRVSFTNALRERLWKPWNGVTGSGSNYGWNGRAGAESLFTLLRVRVCLNADGWSGPPYALNQPARTVTVQRGGDDWDLFTRAEKQCAIADQRLIVMRDPLLHSSPKAKNESTSSAGKSSDQGDTNVSTANDNGSQTGCNTDGGVTTCNSTDSSTLVSGGGGGRSLLSNTTLTAGGRDSSGNNTATVGVRTEVLGFNIINGDSDNPQNPAPVSLGWQSIDSVSPKVNWGNIIKRVKQSLGYTSTSPVKPVIGEWSKRPKYPGIGFGIAYTYLWSVGPIPVMIEFKFGVSAGLGGPVSFGMNYVTTQPTDPNSKDYPCINTTGTRCLVLSSGPELQEKARETCRVRGGRLAELDSNLAVSAAQGRVGSANEEFWVGGQLAYAFTDPKCNVPGADLYNCTTTSTTFYEWTDSQRVFAASNGSNPALLTSNVYPLNWGGVQSDLTGLRTKVPNPAQVSFNGSSRKLTAYPQYQNTQLRYLCEYEPTPKAFGYTYTLSAGLDAAVGFGFSVCTPSTDFGLCLVASLDLLSTSIDYDHRVTHWSLLNGDGSRRGTRSNVYDGAFWTVRFLSGSINAELHTFFFNLRWTIVRFNGIQSVLAKPEDFRIKIYEANYPSRSGQ